MPYILFYLCSGGRQPPFWSLNFSLAYMCYINKFIMESFSCAPFLLDAFIFVVDILNQHVFLLGGRLLMCHER